MTWDSRDDVTRNLKRVHILGKMKKKLNNVKNDDGRNYTEDLIKRRISHFVKIPYINGKDQEFNNRGGSGFYKRKGEAL